MALFLLVASPFLLLFVKNYVLARNLTWTDALFCSPPLPNSFAEPKAESNA